MPEKVKGHYRKGIWVSSYMREPKNRMKVDNTAPRDVKFDKEFHDCCEDVYCCTCGKKLELGENEPVGIGLRKWHRLCGVCLWQMSEAQASLAGKSEDSGGETLKESVHCVEKYLDLLGLPSDYLENSGGE